MEPVALRGPVTDYLVVRPTGNCAPESELIRGRRVYMLPVGCEAGEARVWPFRRILTPLPEARASEVIPAIVDGGLYGLELSWRRERRCRGRDRRVHERERERERETPIVPSVTPYEELQDTAARP